MVPEIGPTAHLLERLRIAQGEPLSLTAAYLPEPIGHYLGRLLPSRASIVTMLDRLGPPTVGIRCSVGVTPADVEAAHALEVPLGAPLLRVRAILTDESGALRAVLESLCRSDRLQLQVLERT